MEMETETIDRLFLELSQVTKAKTKRERDLQDSCRELRRVLCVACDELEGLARIYGVERIKELAANIRRNTGCTAEDALYNWWKIGNS